MTRFTRLQLPGVPQHIIQRGNNRQDIFFHADDRQFFLDKLQYYAETYEVAVHAFVLMTNHLHLLATPTHGDGVSRMMQSLGRVYVRHINKTQMRSGTLMEGRFKSSLVDSDRYFLTVSRYIELNPVRAGMVRRALDYPWSSYRHNIGRRHLSLLTPHDCYDRLGGNLADRQAAYRALFRNQMSDEMVAQIRDVTNKGLPLGNEEFCHSIAAQTGQRATHLPRGGDRKSAAWQEKQKINLL